MIYEETAPAPGLAKEIEAWWRFRVEPHEPAHIQHAIVPDGAVNLSAARGPDGVVRTLIVGPAEKARITKVWRGVDYAGARLRPGGTLRPLGRAPADMVGAVIDEADMPPAFAAWLGEAFAPLFGAPPYAEAEAAFAAWPFARAPADALAQHVADEIIRRHGDVRVGALARAANVGQRRLHRRFKAATGLSPKAFARIRRVRRACVLALDESARLGSVSAEAGYADQAHLSRDIAACFADAPSAVTAYLRRIRHAFAPQGVRNLQDL